MKRIVFFCLIGGTFLVPIRETLAQPNPQDFKRFKDLRQELLDPNPVVNKEAARQLREIADLLFNSVANLTLALESRFPQVRAEAAETLAALNKSADGAILPLIQAAKKEKNDAALAWMITALGAIAPYSSFEPNVEKSLATILSFTTHEDPTVRWKVAATLGNFGEKGKAGVPVLRKLIQDPTPPSRQTALSISMIAMQSLQRIGANDKETIKNLFQFVDCKNVEKRLMAMATLAKLVPKDKRIFQVLLEALKQQENLRLRFGAAGCLALLQSDAKKAVPELIKAMNFHDPNNVRAASVLRRHALRALGAIGEPATKAIPEIRRLADSDPDRSVRRRAQKTLANLQKAHDN